MIPTGQPKSLYTLVSNALHLKQCPMDTNIPQETAPYTLDRGGIYFKKKISRMSLLSFCVLFSAESYEYSTIIAVFKQKSHHIFS